MSGLTVPDQLGDKHGHLGRCQDIGHPGEFLLEKAGPPAAPPWIRMLLGLEGRRIMGGLLHPVRARIGMLQRDVLCVLIVIVSPSADRICPAVRSERVLAVSGVVGIMVWDNGTRRSTAARIALGGGHAVEGVGRQRAMVIARGARGPAVVRIVVVGSHDSQYRERGGSLGRAISATGTGSRSTAGVESRSERRAVHKQWSQNERNKERREGCGKERNGESRTKKEDAETERQR